MSDPINELEYAQAVGELPPAPTPAPALGQHAMHGFAWLMSQALVAKIITMVGQVVLSWLLGSKDYAFVGLAYTISIFVSVIHQGGLREMLVQRGRDLAKWENAAIWYSAALGLLSAGLIAAAAKPAAAFYHDERLTPLILILAAQSLVMALTAVPEARLQMQLRFKFLALLGLVTVSLTMVLSIALAVAFATMPQFAGKDYGAYAFLLPLPVVSVVRLAIGWIAAKPRIRWNPEWHLWAGLTTDNTVLFIASFFYTVTILGDRMALGKWHSKVSVGLYFWAFNLSMQTMQLIQASVASILFPSLATLKDEPARQTKAFVRATQALMLVGLPGCFLQAALADPGVRLVFKAEWFAAIDTLQVLSLAMAMLISSFAAGNIIKAQGRFVLYLVLMIANAVVFMGAVAIGAYLATPQGGAWLVSALAYLRLDAWLPTPVGRAGAITDGHDVPSLYVARSLFVFTWGTSPLLVYAAIKHYGGTWRDVLKIHGGPLVASTLAMGAAWYVGNAIGRGIEGKWVYGLRIAVITLLGCGTYVPLIRLLARDAYEEVKGKLMGMLRRGKRKA